VCHVTSDDATVFYPQEMLPANVLEFCKKCPPTAQQAPQGCLKPWGFSAKVHDASASQDTSSRDEEFHKRYVAMRDKLAS